MDIKAVQDEQNIIIQNVSDELQDAMSLITLLENDLFVQRLDDVYIRSIKIIGRIINSAQGILSEIIKAEA